MNDRISKWNKWDLHIHTRASKVKKGNNEYFGEGYSFSDTEIKDFVKTIFPKNDSKLIAITDHDYFDNIQFLKIKSEVNLLQSEREKDYCILPGVELDVFFKLDSNGEIIIEDDCESYEKSKRTHLILIFNDTNWNEIRYSELHDIIEEKYITDEPVWISNILNKFVQNHFEFIAVPHFTKENGIEDSIKDYPYNTKSETNMETKVNWVLSGYFPLLDASSKDFTNIKTKEMFRQLYKRHGFPFPEILTSDNHDYRLYNDDLELSWFKARPSFKGLKMCCSDYEMRVKYTPGTPISTYISKILINGDPDYVEKNEIELSENLNCVIGGRSSGKSLLLKKIVNASGSTDADDELKNYKKYISNMNVSLLDQDGRPYKGRPEYISQGSIIDKYINSSDNTNLAADFKEYFPKGIDFNSILKDKEIIKTTIIEIDNELERLSKISKNIFSKNPLDYLTISKIKFENTISNKALISIVDNAQTIVNNLKKFVDIIKANKILIEPYKSVLEQYYIFLQKLENEQQISEIRLKQYEIIKKASNDFVYELESKSEGYDKKEKTQVAAIGSFVNLILEWSSHYSNALRKVDFLKQSIATLKQSNSYYNEIPSFKFVIKITNDLKITDILNVFISRFKNKEIRESTKNFYQLIDKMISNDYELYSTKNLQTMLQETIDNSYKIDYLIYEKGELINNMSEGRKVSVFLNILLNKHDSIEPLIIDQPEDDMDNNDIYSILVNSLRFRKSGRQIILATHDSNIVVNGDAENVVYASKKNKKTKITYDFGGLEYEDENVNIQKIICNTLEGGEDAFINRAFKYDLDKTKIYKWRE